MLIRRTAPWPGYSSDPSADRSDAVGRKIRDGSRAVSKLRPGKALALGSHAVAFRSSSFLWAGRSLLRACQRYIRPGRYFSLEEKRPRVSSCTPFGASPGLSTT
uniref:Uncharacterized protein n=1 Tax=Sphaerodactylus townsendi TaxID=933632 RepID=A0ACB8EPA9_9SAUR